MARIRKEHREWSRKCLSLDILEEFKVGIDLEIKFLDVKRLFMAGFGSRVIKMGYDPDDVLQEVYKGLLIRNRGTCPWDRNKASFGHYVHMVTGCILSNYTRKTERTRSREVLGIRGADGEYHDAAEIISGEILFQDNDIEDITRWVRGMISSRDLDQTSKDALVEIVPLLIEGWTKREIARKMGVKQKEVVGMMGVLREVYRGSCSVVLPKNVDASITAST